MTVRSWPGTEADEAEMGVLAWFRGVFSSAGPDDEAAEREEFGVADRGETELRRDTRSGFVPSESADLARHALEAPPDSVRKPRAATMVSQCSLRAVQFPRFQCGPRSARSRGRSARSSVRGSRSSASTSTTGHRPERTSCTSCGTGATTSTRRASGRSEYRATRHGRPAPGRRRSASTSRSCRTGTEMQPAPSTSRSSRSG